MEAPPRRSPSRRPRRPRCRRWPPSWRRLRALFHRAESRASLERYVTGLLTDLPRKNCDAIAAAVAGTSTERLQHLLTDADWDARGAGPQRVARADWRSQPGRRRAGAGRHRPAEAREAVGRACARQYSGTLGRTANCQIVVSAEYLAERADASAPAATGRSARSCTCPVAGPTTRSAVPGRMSPTTSAFQTKPQLALALIDRARAWGVPFRAVVADAGYGRHPVLPARRWTSGAWPYVVGVPSQLRRAQARGGGRRGGRDAAGAVPGRGRPRLPRPAPLYTGRGAGGGAARGRLADGQLAGGTKGPLRKRFAAVRVHWATGEPGGRAGRAQHQRRAACTPARKAGCWWSSPCPARTGRRSST